MNKATGTHKALTIFMMASACVHLMLFYPYRSVQPVLGDVSQTQMTVALVEQRAEPVTKAPPVQAVRKQSESNAETTPEHSTSPSASSREQISVQLSSQIKTRLSEHFEYPFIARRKGYQGTVTLSFRVQANGSLKDIQVARSSGYGILDRSAIRALLKIRKLENIETWLQGDDFFMQLPVRYRLNEG
ncbi:MAG: energy transducer TonB [Gammaproteobacteria bacterium]|nr:energy transducer TonB [Gammaproteobacteria bacterium]